MFKLDFRECGGLVEMICIEKERQWPLSLFGRQEGVANLPDSGRRKNEHIGSFLPCFQLHERWLQVQCILLEPVNKIPLCSPVKLISEELHYFLWEAALQMCHGREPRPAVLPWLQVQEWVFCTAGLKMTLVLLIPTGVTKWAKLPV